MKTFEIVQTQAEQTPARSEGLGGALLLDNVRWFVRVRWIVVCVFLVAGLLGSLFPDPILSCGLVPPVPWAWGMAAFLAAANAIFFMLVRRLDSESPPEAVQVDLWLQIWVDLAAVTVLVHLVGSTETFIPFCYLLHITMACVFFSRLKSFVVVGVSAALYLAMVAMEITGVLESSSILQEGFRRSGGPPCLPGVIAVSAVSLWCLVWYLVSKLAASVRERDQELDRVNRLLLKADEQKNREVLRTAHDLKAPFSGIENNIQVLKLKYWDEASEPVREIIDRIEARSRALRVRTKDILLLGNVRSRQAMEPQILAVELHDVINDVVADLAEKADAAGVTVSVDVPPTTVMTGSRQLSILFSNIISNAIFYSSSGMTVRVSCRDDGESATVSVADEGIGIKEESLPHIFDEYYRTKEAAQFNTQSTGLGLAIVKRIALNLGLGLRVASEEGKGTTFEVTIPKTERAG